MIEQLGAAPEFTVTGGGLYTIHSFVFPTGLDLSVVVPGVTTGFDVNGLLVQGGGGLCASLDVAGAAFNVSDPNAGTLSGGADVCSNGSAVLTATANGDAYVPAGYSQAYVLTSGAGLVIEQLGAAPEFTVTGGGLYTIHSFVFPTGLDLSCVVPGDHGLRRQRPAGAGRWQPVREPGCGRCRLQRERPERGHVERWC